MNCRSALAFLLVAAAAHAGGPPSDAREPTPLEAAAQLLESHRNEAKSMLENQLHGPVDLRVNEALNAVFPNELGCFREAKCPNWKPELEVLRSEIKSGAAATWTAERQGVYLLLLNQNLANGLTQKDIDAENAMRRMMWAPCTANCSGLEAASPVLETRPPISEVEKAKVVEERNAAFGRFSKPIQNGTDCLSLFFRSRLGLFAQGAAAVTPCSEEMRILSLVDGVTYATDIELRPAIRKLEAAAREFPELLGVKNFVLQQQTRLALCTRELASAEKASVAISKLPGDGPELAKAVRLLVAKPNALKRGDIRQMLGCGIAD